MRRLTRILPLMLSMVLAAASCAVEPVQPVSGDEEGIQAGEPVVFTPLVPSARTKALTHDASLEDGYRPVGGDYTFTVSMYRQGNDDPIGSGTFRPSLSPTSTLYWPDNVNAYAFSAVAGTETLEADQSTQEQFLAQDRLSGVAFEPLRDGEDPVDDINNLNYRTSKGWYSANQTVLGVAGAEEYKKIPLYLRHQRSRITIILKAGEGVERSTLATLDNIETTVYSYHNTPAMGVIPLGSETSVDYTSDDFGTPETNVPSVQYTCVVEPHNYLAGATTDPIARINLSGQHFTFYASNDFLAAETDDASLAHMQGYDLTEGKHLVITATLGRGSRKILITAYVVDWEESVTSSIVDDYGQTGDPIQINNRKELYEFLTGPDNKAGNVAIIAPNSLNLEQSEGSPLDWDYPELDLNCTLNLAGATLYTNHRLFRTIAPQGNLVNGTVAVGNASVEAAVATTNNGTIEHVDVLALDAEGHNSTGSASRAGVVVNNAGTLSQCESDLPVYGSGTAVVGGIAALSFYSEDTGYTRPVIDGCTVNANVDGEAGVTGGGIVGQASGRVTGNSFAYGITLLQDHSNFKNSIHSKYTADTYNAGMELRAYGNSWPTTASSNGTGIPDTDTNANTDAQYDAVIDCQAELAALFNGTNYSPEKNYRISADFSVSKTAAGDVAGWNLGEKTDILNTSGKGNVIFKLDGNGHTITTDAMLFSNIQNEVKDLTICLSNNLIATSSTGEAPIGDEVIAPLAYAVCGPTAKISGIRVKGGNFRMQAPTVGGVVVWAYNGATIEDCQCKADIQVWIPGAVAAESRIYTGGIAAMAARATITRCVFHNTDGTLFRNTASGYTTAGTYDETATPTAGIYFGGILGGTVKKGDTNPETPSVVITDCTSWLSTASTNQYRGAIIGYAQYPDASNNLTNGLVTGDSGCQGNWWSDGSRALGTGFGSMTVEQLLGRRNAVTPTQDSTYDE